MNIYDPFVVDNLSLAKNYYYLNIVREGRGIGPNFLMLLILHSQK